MGQMTQMKLRRRTCVENNNHEKKGKTRSLFANASDLHEDSYDSFTPIHNEIIT